MNSPEFTRTIKAGRIFTKDQLQTYFKMNMFSQNFKNWFEDVSDEYEFVRCQLIKKTGKGI